jgi:hypothetical protein
MFNMTVNTTSYFLVLVALALMPIVTIIQLTHLAHTCYRDRLWRLRDDLVDDLLLGRIEPSQGALRLLRVVETHIRIAGRHSLADLLFALFLLRPKEIPSISDEILGGDIRPTDRATLASYFQRLNQANIWHLYAGSVLGWFVFIGLHALRIVPYLGKRRNAGVRPKLTQQAERLELRMPELAPSRRAMEGSDRGPILPLLRR